MPTEPRTEIEPWPAETVETDQERIGLAPEPAESDPEPLDLTRELVESGRVTIERHREPVRESTLELARESVHESVEAVQTEHHVEAVAQTAPGDVPEEMLVLQHRLQEAAAECGRLQKAFVSQRQLEELLRHGRAHLQDLRTQLQHMTAERDLLLTQKAAAEERERDLMTNAEDHRRKIKGLQEQLKKTQDERETVTGELEAREKAYKQFAEERADERMTFERLLAEATANQREMAQELDEQRQQIQTLREAAMRAQSLARQIMRAQENALPDK